MSMVGREGGPVKIRLCGSYGAINVVDLRRIIHDLGEARVWCANNNARVISVEHSTEHRIAELTTKVEELARRIEFLFPSQPDDLDGVGGR